MRKIIIRQIPVEPFQILTYIVACPQSSDAVIIDPAGDEDKLLALIETKGLHIKYILNTHGHADHVLGNPKLKNLLNIPGCMHETDDRFFNDPSVRKKSSRELELPPADPVNIRLKDGDILEEGILRIEVVHTPGHTPGSVCYQVGNNLFTGDTLFEGAAGRTDIVGVAFEHTHRVHRKKIDRASETNHCLAWTRLRRASIIHHRQRNGRKSIYHRLYY